MHKEAIYRVYVTDCLKSIAENTAKIGGGSTMKSRYCDIIQPQKNVAPEKSADEIISDIRKKLDQIRGEKNE